MGKKSKLKLRRAQLGHALRKRMAIQKEMDTSLASNNSESTESVRCSSIIMALKNHCLFCLERTVPYSVLPKSSSINGGELEVGIIGGELGEEGPPDFQSLCKYLKISLPKRKTGFVSSILSSSCDKILCLSCFEMVERLEELHKELAGIQRRIRKIILDHDISSHLSSISRMRREEFEKEVGLKESEEEGQNDCLAFVEMFQTLIKDCADADNAAADIRNVEIDEFKMNVELDLDGKDRRNYGVEVDPLSTEVYNDMIGSPLEDEHPFDTSEMESESRTEYDDEPEQKPEIKTDLTDKKKSKKRQWQSLSSPETNSVSSRTRKSLRPTTVRIPEPSISTSDTEESKETVPMQQFKCADCDLSFTSYSKRYEHRRKSHPVKLSTLKSLLASIPMVHHIRKPGRRNMYQNGKRTYICTICNQHVNERNPNTLLNYMEHMLSHDYQSTPDQEGPHSCSQCDKQFNLKISLDLHVACIHDARQQVIRCHLCKEDANYGSREALVEHLKSTHGDTVYTCKHCPMAYVSFEKLLEHMRNHSKCRRLICPECVAVSTTMSELHEHCYKAHPELKETYNCEPCDKIYLEKQALTIHMEIEHGFDRKSKTFETSLGVNLECPQCKRNGIIRTYKNQFALRTHIKTSHEREKIHKCDQCEDKWFDSKYHLREHVEKIHDKVRYPCPYCPNLYMTLFSLNQHLKTHTKEGLYICEVCSKECTTKSKLERHMSSHVTAATGEEWACKDCGQVFLSRYRLLAHRRNVHTKKSKVCPICGVEVKRVSSLLDHIKRHTGERSFRHQCPTCNLSFTLKDILNRHLNEAHGMEVGTS